MSGMAFVMCGVALVLHGEWGESVGKEGPT